MDPKKPREYREYSDHVSYDRDSSEKQRALFDSIKGRLNNLNKQRKERLVSPKNIHPKRASALSAYNTGPKDVYKSL